MAAHLTIKGFTFNPFQTNLYVCHSEGEAVLIDPASNAEAERRQVLGYIEANGLAVRHLLLTHAHIDHIFDCRFYADRFGLGWRMHRSDHALLKASEEQGRLFGMRLEPAPEPEGFLEEGDTVAFGGAEMKVVHAPGHSPGSICFFEETARELIAGDVLFQGSIGRTDLWMGSLPQLLESIFQKLLPLGDDVTVHPGHGPATTIGEERRSNPFLTEGFSRL